MNTIKDCNCAYCMNNELLDAFGIKICDLNVSQLYLFKEQSHKGRVIVASNYHISEITELDAEGRAAFFEDVNRASLAVHKAFNPDKVNYGAYGDSGHHLHFHLVPKYKDGYEWNGVFQMNPKEKFLSEDEYSKLIAQIKENL